MSEEKKVLRYPLIPLDIDISGLGIVLNSGPIDKISFAQFFVELILVDLPTATGDQVAVVKELIQAFAECKAGNEPEIREVAHAALLTQMNVRKEKLIPTLFLKILSFYAAIAGAPTERREIKEAGTSEDRDGDETTNEPSKARPTTGGRQTA